MSENHTIERLDALLRTENFVQAQKVCNALLTQDPDDVDLRKVEAFLLLELEEFEKAANVCGNRYETAFEKAYALYRLFKNEDALKVLDEFQNELSEDERCLWLRGQVEYRMGQYANAAARYEKLVAMEGEQPSAEALANLSAAYAGMKKRTDMQSNKDTLSDTVRSAFTHGESNGDFELLYNQSYAAFMSGDLNSALKLLDDSEKACEKTFADNGFSSQDLERELSVLRIQRAFLLYRTGHVNEASKLYSKLTNVSKNSVADESIVAIANANLGCLRGNKNAMDALRRVEAALAPELAARHIPEQIYVLTISRLILLLRANKVDACRAAAMKVAEQYPGDATPAIVLCALSNRGKRSTKNLNMEELPHEIYARLQTSITNEKCPPGVTIDVDWQKDLANIYSAGILMRHGETHAALQRLNAISLKNRFTVAFVATELHMALNKVQDASEDKALHTWKKTWQNATEAYNNKELTFDAYSNLMQFGLWFLMQLQDDKEAQKLIEQLETLGKQTNVRSSEANKLLLVACAAKVSIASRTQTTVDTVDKTITELDDIIQRVYGNVTLSEVPQLPEQDILEQIHSGVLPWRRGRTGIPSSASSIVSEQLDTSLKFGKNNKHHAEEENKNGIRYRTEAAREKRLKQRKARRDAYLTNLKTTRFANIPIPKPDPERWIPRMERSYNRARRRKQQRKQQYENKGGAQGVGSAAVNEKDAVGLDARAQAEAKAGTETTSKSKQHGNRRGKR